MNLIGLVLVLVVIGFCLWLIQTYIPMSPPIKTLITVVVVIIIIIVLLQALGLTGTNIRLR